jgi:hypothetical protein
LWTGFKIKGVILELHFGESSPEQLISVPRGSFGHGAVKNKIVLRDEI